MNYQCVGCQAEYPEGQAKNLLCLSCGGVLLPILEDDQAHMYSEPPPPPVEPYDGPWPPVEQF